MARNIHEQGQALLSEITDVEKDAVIEKLERLQRDIVALGEIPVLSVSQPGYGEPPGGEGASSLVGPMNVHDMAENGDSDLGDSESGVSSMESFEVPLRKENGRASSENGLQENGVSNYHLENVDLDDNEILEGGISVSPDEYQRIRMSKSGESNEEIMASFESVGLENGFHAQNVKEILLSESRRSEVNLPILTVTDENGTPAEVEFAENATEKSLGKEGFGDQAGDFFFDDFDVYYGDRPSEAVDNIDEVSERYRMANEEIEGDLTKSDAVTNKESNSDSSLTDGAVDLSQTGGNSGSHVNDISEVALTPRVSKLKDDFDISDDSELEKDVLRHSTPTELVATTADNVNTTPDLLERTTDSTEVFANVTETCVPPLIEKKMKGDTSLDRDLHADSQNRNSTADTIPTNPRDSAPRSDLEPSFVSLGPNEEMDQLDKLLNINGNTSEDDVRNTEGEKPQDKIASILSQRRKAEEAERLRFAENSVRDADYELFTSRPLDLIDRSSPLKDLDESENILHENMSLDAFLVEVEKLLEKLHSIEELITTDLEDEDNVKDELAKHVVISSFKFNSFQSLEYD